MKREKFGTRLGFILISAGCAIGLGNVWRFPYVVGQYGGAAFVLIYIFFLIILGLPIMVMEFSVGRASQASVAMSFDKLERPGAKWHLHKYTGMAGNYILMMFYTTIGGWILLYFIRTMTGSLDGLTAAQISDEFDALMGRPWLMTGCMAAVVIACFGICSLGLQNGVEKITKVMMTALLVLMIVLAVHSVTLPGAGEGISFYLKPDLQRLLDAGLSNAIFAAMGQSFFTLSIGVGSIAIFGSYIDKSRSLTGEAVCVTALDTGVALTAGLIIFPACFAYGVPAQSGPPLIFKTLPIIFNNMYGGRIWGSMFFLCMLFAAGSTIIAVFENIISFAIDLWGWSRRRAVLVNMAAILVLSMPCVLGFNLLSGIEPLGAGSTVLDLEDFLVSSNLLPLGSLVYLFFCTSRYGWGWDNFLNEANAGAGLKFPKALRFYVSFILPLIVLAVFIQGYAAIF